MKEKKLGEILLDKGLIKPDQLELALDIQQNEKSMLGKILVGHDYIRNLDLHMAMAEKYGLEFVDLTKSMPDKSLLNPSLREQYFSLELIPYRQNADSVTLAVCNINEEVKNWATKNFPGKQTKFMITSPFDIRHVLQDYYTEQDNEQARLKLWISRPLYSARKIFQGMPWKSLIIACAVIFGFSYSMELSFITFVTLMNLFFFCAIIFKTVIFASGYKAKPHGYNEPTEYPVYTILLPLYREEKTLSQLITSIGNLDYPKSKLDVKFVVEADDEITIQAIKKLRPPAYMEIIKVPYSLPRTKPKACNYAFTYARGEYVTIYDAEDRPDPAQLKKALSRFAEDNKIACVQARLNYYNYNDSQLTRWFALEYGIWFDFVLKGFERFGMPIALGGTSNHIKADVLRTIGGWDSFNVTEDADLGYRLAREGYKVGTINSLTEEEAPNKINAWFKQRRRWIKGFMQTYIVHMRSIRKLLSKVGIRGFLGLQFFIGIPAIVYLLTPLLVISVTIMPYEYPELLIDIMFFNLFFGVASHMAMCALVAYKAVKNDGKQLFKKSMNLSCATFPVYFVLHIIASYKALYQLILRPHYWDKTEHGLAKNDQHNMAA